MKKIVVLAMLCLVVFLSSLVAVNLMFSGSTVAQEPEVAKEVPVDDDATNSTIVPNIVPTPAFKDPAIAECEKNEDCAVVNSGGMIFIINGIMSLRGHYEELGLSLNNINISTRPNVSMVIYWRKKKKKKDYITTFIKDILQESRGWVRAGVNFKYTTERSSELDVLFTTYPRIEMGKICGTQGLSACAGVKIVDERFQCTVFLAQDFFDGSSVWYQNRYSVVNHEVGHCFGLIHNLDPNDIMFPLANHRLFAEYPSPREIAFLVELFKSGKVYDAIAKLHNLDLTKMTRP